eukprot:CAMPEP_0170950126 /NCGR_PEP_ID=MMETSP0735-20130129/29735_1 /TAXON_ID=186038 /ORGANISM="Fragilariopsis kerguelensis, Strain L26-C5" /LENGTH=173 /DNA_ID=CAMNT_0011360421 /DNA_START=66 /DNA_END=583 /DNA_ORIENTATION=+
MADLPTSQGRVAKKVKLVGRDFSGKRPKVFLDDGIVKMEFHIHDFASLPQKRGESYFTGIIKAHGHLWKLRINPRGHFESDANDEYVSMYLVYDGDRTKTNPVVTKAVFRTKTSNGEIPKHGYHVEMRWGGWSNWETRKDMIEKDCDDAGTLTITVELQVATEKRSVWYPQLT